jgi:hypothetical protein
MNNKKKIKKKQKERDNPAIWGLTVFCALPGGDLTGHLLLSSLTSWFSATSRKCIIVTRKEPSRLGAGDSHINSHFPGNSESDKDPGKCLKHSRSNPQC